MKIFISAAEASSDAHGAELLRAIRLESHSEVEAIGMGGPKLREAGLRSIVDARELLAMGFLEIASRLPRIFRALDALSEAVRQERPDLVIVIDYPDFHIRLAKRLHALGIPVIYYIPPKLWAWRQGRIEQIRKLFVKVLCILPFEETFYARQGVAATYVGNPLLDELPLAATRGEARARLDLAESERVLVLMPGSRPHELKRHLALMLEAATQAVPKLRAAGYLPAGQKLRVLIPFPATADLEALSRQVGHGSAEVEFRCSQGNAADCLLAADAGLIKSGTSTLEAGLLGCPHTILYKPNALTWWIFKLFIRYPGPIGLVNLIAEPEGVQARRPFLVTELLCPEVTVSALVDEIVSLLTDEARRRRLAEGFRILRKKLLGGEPKRSPSLFAAREVLRLLAGAGNP